MPQNPFEFKVGNFFLLKSLNPNFDMLGLGSVDILFLLALYRKFSSDVGSLYVILRLQNRGNFASKCTLILPKHTLT